MAPRARRSEERRPRVSRRRSRVQDVSGASRRRARARRRWKETRRVERLVFYLLPACGVATIGERREERLVVAVDAVAELRVDAGVERRRERRRAGHRAQRDVDHVVGEPAAVREARRRRRRARRADSGCATARSRRSAAASPTAARSGGWFSPGMPVRKIVTRSLRGVGGDWMPKSAESSFGTSGSVTKPQRGGVAGRLERVERVLGAARDDDLVDERLAEPRHLHEVAVVLLAARRRASSPTAGWPWTRRRSTAFGSARRRRPRAVGASARAIGTSIAIVCTLKPASESAVVGVGRRHGEQVEHVQIDEERIVALAGEHLRCRSAAAAPPRPRAPS